MPYRVSYMFQMTTDPLNREAASPHSGGWTEGHWLADPPVVGGNGLYNWAYFRSMMLPTEVDIVGYRVAAFTIDHNRLIPGGVSSFRGRWPGNATYETIDLPQNGLMFGAGVSGQPSAVRFTVRGLPDNQISRGEYQPTPGYVGTVNRFMSMLRGVVVAGGLPFPGVQWGSIVRNKVLFPSVRVLSIAQPVVPALNGTIVVGAGGNFTAGGFVRLRRVRNDSGVPISGAFLITNVAGTVLTVSGLPTNAVVTRPNGLAYQEELTFAPYNSVQPSRAVVRKIGSPPEKYRGRRSKRRT